MEPASIAAIGAVAVAVLTPFFGFMRWIVVKFIDALNKNTKAMNSVAAATTKSAREAEKRNGHLADLAIENKRANADQNKAILLAIGNLPTQHVKEQVVDNQTVNTIKKTAKKKG